MLALVRMGLAVLALAPATVLMGATLPTLTRYLTRNGQLSAAFGKLYAANTIGAIVGTLAAGIVLIELFGLTVALAIGAGCSAVAGLGALWLARGEADARSTRRSRPRRGTRRAPATAVAPPGPTAMTDPDVLDRPDRTRLALGDRLRVGAHVARLPGPLDPAAGIGDRQHHVRLHGHPRRCS